MRVRFIKAIQDVSADRWNSLVDKHYPFARHEFLKALEDSASVSIKNGWQPLHVLLEEDEQLIACLPLYIKTHSYGEYVFDQGWAQAYEQHGIAYYPKLLSAIPFTPSPGPRLLTLLDPDLIWPLIIQGLDERCRTLGLSGWHILFLKHDDIVTLNSESLHVRLGCQFHWHNKNFTSFEDFLSTMSSRKRKDIVKERRYLREQGIDFKQLKGEEISEELLTCFYNHYVQTYSRKSGHGGYLNQAFFLALLKSMPENVLLVVAYRDEKIIASALNIVSDTVLYGRYWGADEAISGLHFEVCYYQGIEYCIDNGLSMFDAGAQGEHKIQRGFEPTLTYSCHGIMHQGFSTAIANFLQEEASAIQEYQQQMATYLPFK